MYEKRENIEPATQAEIDLKDRLFTSWKKSQKFFTEDMQLTNGFGGTFDNRACREVIMDFTEYQGNGALLSAFDAVEGETVGERRERILTQFKQLEGKDLPAIGVLASDLKPFLEEACLKGKDLVAMRHVAIKSLIALDTEQDPRAEWAVQEWQKVLGYISASLPALKIPR